MLTGDAFTACHRDGDGEIHQAGVLASERVTVESRGGLPLYRVTTLDGRVQTVTERDAYLEASG